MIIRGARSSRMCDMKRFN